MRGWTGGGEDEGMWEGKNHMRENGDRPELTDSSTAIQASRLVDHHLHETRQS